MSLALCAAVITLVTLGGCALAEYQVAEPERQYLADVPKRVEELSQEELSHLECTVDDPRSCPLILKGCKDLNWNTAGIPPLHGYSKQQMDALAEINTLCAYALETTLAVIRGPEAPSKEDEILERIDSLETQILLNSGSHFDYIPPPPPIPRALTPQFPVVCTQQGVHFICN